MKSMTKIGLNFFLSGNNNDNIVFETKQSNLINRII